MIAKNHVRLVQKKSAEPPNFDLTTSEMENEALVISIFLGGNSTRILVYVIQLVLGKDVCTGAPTSLKSLDLPVCATPAKREREQCVGCSDYAQDALFCWAGVEVCEL